MLNSRHQGGSGSVRLEGVVGEGWVVGHSLTQPRLDGDEELCVALGPKRASKSREQIGGLTKWAERKSSRGAYISVFISWLDNNE